jgi:hypothetical protein
MLFFISGPDYYAPRSFKNLWNLGHIIFFSLLPLLVFSALKKSKSYPRQVLYIIVLTLLLGTLIEILQTGLDGRIPDMGDIFRNIIGALVGSAFLLLSRKNLPRKQLVAIQLLVILLVFLQMVPIINAFWDENIAKRQFPLLSGFETPFETDRWMGGAAFEVSDDIRKNGATAMKVMLNTDTYSGVALKYFPGDWDGYHFFQFSVFNPDSDKLKLTCRIHDWQHTQCRQKYEDRFNRSFSISQGWLTITIPLEQVELAPENRRMDMKRIQGVGIFAVRLPHSRTIYIDDVGLKP